MYTQSPNILAQRSPQDRSEVVDLLRGLSILLVVLYHGDDFFTVQASALAPLLRLTPHNVLGLSAKRESSTRSMA